MLSNDRGQSLIQVLIVLGLSGMVAAMFAQLSIQGLKNEKNIESLFEANNLQNEVLLALQNPAVCASNLNPTNFVTLTFDATPSTLLTQVIGINQLTYPDGSIMAKLNMVFGTAHLTVSKIWLTYFKELVPGTSYSASLRLQFTKPINFATGSQVFERDMPILLTTSFTAAPIVKINGCVAAGVTTSTGTSSSGGGYTIIVDSAGTSSCSSGNPKSSGACSCPTGTSPISIGSIPSLDYGSAGAGTYSATPVVSTYSIYVCN